MAAVIEAVRKRLPEQKPAEERARALKERIYASFTGLAIVVVIYSDVDHTAALDAFLSLAVGIIGIAAAGFVAEVIAHQVTHTDTPSRADLRTMARISSGALASASIPLLVAVGRTRLRLSQKLIALVVMLGFCALVVLVLLVAHLH
ncbi:hypothetical protein [Cryobacterium arcticum]|uniref:Uncharacterized protein n=1 Tax=Cryobacterium arcticum TaxID=670052 RepID=A0A317ZUU3_9MICO|nr:hypothetical protein [Cryobacterium arcticum]PXA68444.1 hypothetical protein CTB96_17765 [Cryobacterium arcticum]